MPHKLISLGSDPELFLEDENGKVISAIGKIGGTKKKPRPLKDLGRGFFVQEDNVLLEYNTPICKSTSSWQITHAKIQSYLASMVGQLGLKISTKASHSMDLDQMQDPQAWVLGCDPDYDAWNLKWNTKPGNDDPLLRSAGGHIHVGYSNPNAADSIRLLRILDYFVGAPLKRLDPDKKRAELYGKPGAGRFKPYGVEYRTPSNFWTLSTKATAAIYNNVMHAVSLIDSYDKQKYRIDTAKAYLAGEEDDFDDTLFALLGMSYNEKKLLTTKSIYDDLKPYPGAGKIGDDIPFGDELE